MGCDMQLMYARESSADFPHGLIHLMSRTNMAIWQLITQKTTAISGLTGMQASLLLLVAGRHNMTSVDLAREYKIYPSGITRLVDHLVRRGLVHRVPCEKDRRVTYLLATPDGKEAASQLPSVFDSAYATLFDGMKENDVDALKRCLRHILLNVRAAEELSNPPGNESFLANQASTADNFRGPR